MILILLFTLGILFFLSLRGYFVLEQQLRTSKGLAAEYTHKLGKLKNDLAHQQQDILNITIKKLEQDLSEGNGFLTESQIDQLHAFSRSLKPYFPSARNDSSLISPERGLLLKTICQIKMDSSTYLALLSRLDFSYADLSNSSFQNVNLSNANLKKADMSYSTFENVKLTSAKLEGADLGHSEIKNCALSRADLGDVLLHWTTLSETRLNHTELNGADALNANFLTTDLSNANLKWMRFVGTFIENSNFDSSDLMSAIFNNSTIVSSSFNNSRIRNSNWVNSSVSQSSFDFVAVDEQWLSELDKRNIKEAQEFRNEYARSIDSSDLFLQEKFFIKRLE